MYCLGGIHLAWIGQGITGLEPVVASLKYR